MTVGTQEKIDYAVNVLGVARDHIFNSRDDSFLQDVMRATNGQGVDIVLNSLSGPLLHASWKCVAEFGKMIELSKSDLSGHGSLDMEPFLLNRSFCCVDMAVLSLKRREVAQQLVSQILLVTVLASNLTQELSLGYLNLSLKESFELQTRSPPLMPSKRRVRSGGCRMGIILERQS